MTNKAKPPTYLDRLVAELDEINRGRKEILAASAIKNIDPNRYRSRDFVFVGSLEQMNDLATRLITCWEAIRV